MTLLAPATGEMAMLDNALKTASPEALYLKLYTNNYDPVNGSILGNFTECALAGYAQKSLTRAGWNSAVSGNPSYSQYSAAQVFNFAATGQIVGYYLVGVTSNVVYWAERLYPTAGQTVNSGDSISVTPKITAT